MIVLGFTGTFAAGKDAVISIVQNKFYLQCFEVNTGDFVREETRKRGLPLTRENLQMVSNDVRLKHGAGFFGKKTVEQITRHSDKNIFLVSGIRTIGEVEELRKAFGNKFYLIAVDAPIEVRYQRVKQRAREGEHVLSFEEFKASQEKELRGPAHSQNIIAAMNVANFTVQNNGTIKELEKKIEKILERIGTVN